MDNLRIALSGVTDALIDMKEVADYTNSHLVYLVPISLIPNSDGTFQPDWVITGTGQNELNLANYWVGTCYYNPT